VRGFFAALTAYLTWGLFPIYFHAVRAAGALEIVAHRVIWSVVLLLAIVTVQRRWGELGPAWRSNSPLTYLASTACITSNWLLFVWGANTDRVLELSLGYFMNPLVNVLLGVTFLHETLTPRQRLAVAMAACGVLAMAIRIGTLPWLSLGLAFSFGLYGFVRKRAHIEPTFGLVIETAILTPFLGGYLLWLAGRGQGAFGSSLGLTLLLASAGVITAIPLILFAVGVRTLRLSTMGLIQYVTPTCHFLLAVAFFHERFTVAHAIAFPLIWSSLAIYTWDALRPRVSAGA
jgi:chloramphenicol-sensitive protein RarD